MPTRFPGMDPWLEAPSRWPGVHATLISTIRELLVPQIRPRYFADIESRVYILGEDDPARRVIVPDVIAFRGEPRKIERGIRGGTAAAPASVVLNMMAEIPVREGRVVIRTPDGRDVIAVLELLSPANKTRGSRGREEYLVKRREVLHSNAHLIEVDLLRAGVRFPTLDALPQGDYYAHVSRAGERPRGYVWAWTVREPAPVIPVPLGEGEPDATIDLAAAIHLAYERGGYDVAIDYGKPPEPPLSPEDAEWVAQGLSR